MLIGGRSHGGVWSAELLLLLQTLCKSASGCCGLRAVASGGRAGSGRRRGRRLWLAIGFGLLVLDPLADRGRGGKKGGEKLDD